LLSACDIALQRVLQLVGLLFRSTESKDLQIVVLRHQLRAHEPSRARNLVRSSRTRPAYRAEFRMRPLCTTEQTDCWDLDDYCGLSFLGRLAGQGHVVSIHHAEPRTDRDSLSSKVGDAIDHTPH